MFKEIDFKQVVEQSAKDCEQYQIDYYYAKLVLNIDIGLII